jgi:hypothetical protein
MVQPAVTLPSLQAAYVAHCERFDSALEIMSSLADSEQLTRSSDLIHARVLSSDILTILHLGHPAGPAPVTLSELAVAVATQRRHLASAFEIVNSLPRDVADLLDEEYGTMVGDDLRRVIDETGIWRFLRPVPLVGLCVDPASPPTLSVPLPSIGAVHSLSAAEESASARAAQSVADQTRARADAALSEKSASAATALAQQHRKMQSAADKARARAEAELQGLQSLNAATAALADDVAISNARERAVSDAAVAAAECKLTSAESKLTAMEAKLGEEAAAASAHVLDLERDV